MSFSRIQIRISIYRVKEPNLQLMTLLLNSAPRLQAITNPPLTPSLFVCVSLFFNPGKKPFGAIDERQLFDFFLRYPSCFHYFTFNIFVKINPFCNRFVKEYNRMVIELGKYCFLETQVF